MEKFRRFAKYFLVLQILIFLLGQSNFIQQLAGLGIWGDWRYSGAIVAAFAGLLLALHLMGRKSQRQNEDRAPGEDDPD